MTRQTVLNELHRRLGARMVEFGGWEMPLYYGSQIEEHHAVRRDCGMFDVSHMGVIDVSGTEATPFLRRLLANDVARLAQPGRALYSVMLNEAGGVVDDLIVYALQPGRYRLVVNASTTEKDLAWIKRHCTEWGYCLDIHPRVDLAMIAVQGPQARQRVWQAFPLSRCSEDMPRFSAVECGPMFIARTGYTGEDGFELALPKEQAESCWQRLQEAGVRPCGLGARDTLRLEAGMPLYGQEMDETVSPLDAGLGWTVALHDARDFVGKHAVLAQGQRWQLAGLLLLDRGVLRSQQRVLTAHGAGRVTSGGFAPTLQQSIGLARLPRAVSCGEAVEVEIRDRRHAARVVKPPFVRNGKILI
ncbi:MAG: glycine cleavage system aminomethyltransferase GcvT [Methylophilaceae bacterium]|nr:glycine cleavage system aminomethyltransferase GcvT [Methylophilaceae bacterium]